MKINREVVENGMVPMSENLFELGIAIMRRYLVEKKMDEMLIHANSDGKFKMILMFDNDETGEMVTEKRSYSRKIEA